MTHAVEKASIALAPQPFLYQKSISGAFPDSGLGNTPGIRVPVGDRVQLVMGEGIFVVAVPGKLEGFLDGSRTLFLLVAIGIVRWATRWHGKRSLRAESNGCEASCADGFGEHVCLDAQRKLESGRSLVKVATRSRERSGSGGERDLAWGARGLCIIYLYVVGLPHSIIPYYTT